MSPTVSIIVPSYNYENYIKQALDSISAQSFKDFELIIVDDGSIDNSVGVIEQWLKDNSHISSKLLFHPDRANKNIVETYKLAFANSSGKYLAFLEADDFWHPNNLLKKVDALENNPSVVLSSSFGTAVTESDEQFQNLHLEHLQKILGEDVNKPLDLSESYQTKPSMNFIPSFSSAVVSKNKILDLYLDTSFTPWYDCWLWAQMAQKGDFFIIDEKLFYWRVHGKSFNTTFTKSIDLEKYTQDFETALRTILDTQKG